MIPLGVVCRTIVNGECFVARSCSATNFILTHERYQILGTASDEVYAYLAGFLIIICTVLFNERRRAIRLDRAHANSPSSDIEALAVIAVAQIVESYIKSYLQRKISLLS